MIFRRRGKKPSVIDATVETKPAPSSGAAAQSAASPTQAAQMAKTDPARKNRHGAVVQDFTAPSTNQAQAQQKPDLEPVAAQGADAGVMRKKRADVMVQDFTVAAKTPQMDKAETLVEFLHPVNRLKKKVGDGATGFDPGVFVRANEVIKNLASVYIDDTAMRGLREMQATFQALQHFPDRAKESIAKLYAQSHEMRGDGGSYGYPLITRISDSLCRLTEGLRTPEKMDMGLIKFHLDALHVVIRKKIRGIGGEIGQLLIEGLEVVVAKRKAHDQSLVLENISKFLEKLDGA